MRVVYCGMDKSLILAYLGGLIDGEGHIGIKRSYSTRECKSRTFHERLSVGMQQRTALVMLSQRFGGTVVPRSQVNTSFRVARPYFVWEIADRMAASACTVLLPYLRIKRKQAMLVLKLRASKDRGYKRPAGGLMDSRVIEYRERLYRRVRALQSYDRP